MAALMRNLYSTRIPKKTAWYAFFVLILSLFASSESYATPPLRAPRQCPPPEPPPAHCVQAGDWFTRLRALYYQPHEMSGSFDTGPYNQGGVDVRPFALGEFDFGCMITQHFGFEISLSTGQTSVRGIRSLEGTKIGNTWLFPPILTFQWRFATNQVVQPYIGAGGNYTLFYGMNSSLPQTSMRLRNTWGPVAQGGIDLFFCDNYRWLFNIDVKYVWSETRAKLKTHDIEILKASVHVDLNPWIFACGIGCKW